MICVLLLTLESLHVIASEEIELLSSRGFKFRKWVANFHAKEILSSVSHCDLATKFSQVNKLEKSLSCSMGPAGR